MLNHIILTGRLTAKPEIRNSSANIPYVSFTLAVKRNYCDRNGEAKTDFIRIQAWRNLADFVCRYFDKGDGITVEGSLETNKYKDMNGDSKTAYEVQAERVLFPGGSNTKSKEKALPSVSENEDYGESFPDYPIPTSFA